jgi:HAD superfamily hydrolase (TIGR01549 family)
MAPGDRTAVTAPPGDRWVCLDIGETLIEETRIWSAWADVLGIPRMTFLAAFGVVVERGLEYQDAFAIFDVEDWRDRIPAVDGIVGALTSEDLYPDAIPALAGLAARGYRVAVAGNQPARRNRELRALGVEPEAMAMSEELGASKPDIRFFDRTLDLLGRPEPSDVAYVGDRLDNDVGPATAAGMRAVWLRRGPWGRLPNVDGRQSSPGQAALTQAALTQAALTVASLDELVERIDEAWGTHGP